MVHVISHSHPESAQDLRLVALSPAKDSDFSVRHQLPHRGFQLSTFNCRLSTLDSRLSLSPHSPNSRTQIFRNLTG
jgi:hypothetical protein